MIQTWVGQRKVPNSGKYPASATSDHACPSTDELPNGLASFIDKIFDSWSSSQQIGAE